MDATIELSAAERDAFIADLESWFGPWPIPVPREVVRFVHRYGIHFDAVVTRVSDVKLVSSLPFRTSWPPNWSALPDPFYFTGTGESLVTGYAWLIVREGPHWLYFREMYSHTHARGHTSATCYAKLLATVDRFRTLQRTTPAGGILQDLGP